MDLLAEQLPQLGRQAVLFKRDGAQLLLPVVEGHQIVRGPSGAESAGVTARHAPTRA
jgi:hypothetical protein